MAATESGAFPQVDIEVGKLSEADPLSATLPVTISLSGLRAALLESSQVASKKGTPVPSSAIAILEQAIHGCTDCHYKGEDMQPVGAGFYARCSGFDEPEGDLFAVLQSVNLGSVTAEMFILPPHKERSNFPILPTPCCLKPAVIFENYVPRL